MGVLQTSKLHELCIINYLSACNQPEVSTTSSFFRALSYFSQLLFTRLRLLASSTICLGKVMSKSNSRVRAMKDMIMRLIMKLLHRFRTIQNRTAKVDATDSWGSLQVQSISLSFSAPTHHCCVRPRAEICMSACHTIKKSFFTIPIIRSLTYFNMK